MGAYEDYVKAVEAARNGKTMEERIDAAMDADNAFKEAKQRLLEFVTEYVEETAEYVRLAQQCRAGGDEKTAEGLDQHRQHVASMARRPDGSQARLLLDDLRVFLHLLERSKVVPLG